MNTPARLATLNGRRGGLLLLALILSAMTMSSCQFLAGAAAGGAAGYVAGHEHGENEGHDESDSNDESDD